jgi:hypothetical protein
MSDINLPIDDDARRMTYAELAEVRGITIPAARRLTLRHHWAKQTGNDGLVRVSVPVSALAKSRKAPNEIDTTSDPTLRPKTDPVPDLETDTARAIRVLESAVTGLLEQLTVANQRADRERERADQAERRITELLADQRVAPPAIPITQQPAARRSWWPWRK